MTRVFTLFITIFESWVLLRSVFLYLPVCDTWILTFSRTLFVGILQSEVLFSVAAAQITKDIKACAPQGLRARAPQLRLARACCGANRNIIRLRAHGKKKGRRHWPNGL